MSVSSILACAERFISTKVFGSHHDMADHAFSPGSHGPSRLYYQGDVPILEIQSDNPYEAGLAQGLLLGSSLQKLMEQFEVLQLLNGIQSRNVKRTLEAVSKTIPSEYLEEMRGIVDGFNQWKQKYNWFDRREISFDELLLFHLMPDLCHFDPNKFEAASLKRAKKDQQENAGSSKKPCIKKKKASSSASPSKKTSGKRKGLACTVVIDRDKEKGLVFGRNMDWPSYGLGLLGTFSLIINRKYSNSSKRSTAEIGFPGLVGSITGMNDSGFSLAMNVCDGDTKQVQGMPAAFFNRICLEQAQRVDDVAALLKIQRPLGAYHLNIADRESAKAFHLSQGNGRYVARSLQNGNPLVTINSRYTASGRMIKDSGFDEERIGVINRLYQETASKKSKLPIEELVAECLSLPVVNSDITMHKVVFFPESKGMRVAFDNQYCGTVALHEVDTRELFARAY